MVIAVLAADHQVAALMNAGIAQDHQIVRVSDISQLQTQKADVFIDMLFVHDQQRVQLLKKLLPAPVIINSVITTLESVGAPFVRINGWNGFLERPVAEVALHPGADKDATARLFDALNWKSSVVPDVPGMVSARIIAMIINEAYFALDQQVSSKNEIDVAMRLGTNYPYGPFEWSEKIGLPCIAALLETLYSVDERYQPSPLLLKEAAASSAANC